jgi:hypothetical protein
MMQAIYHRNSSPKTRIDVTDQPEVAYWTRKWDISTEQLIEAVHSTGSNLVHTLEKYLKPVQMMF